MFAWGIWKTGSDAFKRPGVLAEMDLKIMKAFLRVSLKYLGVQVVMENGNLTVCHLEIKGH